MFDCKPLTAALDGLRCQVHHCVALGRAMAAVKG